MKKLIVAAFGLTATVASAQEVSIGDKALILLETGKIISTQMSMDQYLKIRSSIIFLVKDGRLFSCTISVNEEQGHKLSLAMCVGVE